MPQCRIDLRILDLNVKRICPLAEAQLGGVQVSISPVPVWPQGGPNQETVRTFAGQTEAIVVVMTTFMTKSSDNLQARSEPTSFHLFEWPTRGPNPQPHMP